MQSGLGESSLGHRRREEFPATLFSWRKAARYANNSFIMEFPFDIIKIDKSILWGADNNEKADRLLHHIISMIHDLEMKVVVEGVETQVQRKKLEKAGVEYLQGYLFSKPVPEKEALEVIAQR